MLCAILAGFRYWPISCKDVPGGHLIVTDLAKSPSGMSQSQIASMMSDSGNDRKHLRTPGCSCTEMVAPPPIGYSTTFIQYDTLLSQEARAEQLVRLSTLHVVTAATAINSRLCQAGRDTRPLPDRGRAVGSRPGRWSRQRRDRGGLTATVRQRQHASPRSRGADRS